MHINLKCVASIVLASTRCNIFFIFFFTNKSNKSNINDKMFHILVLKEVNFSTRKKCYKFNDKPDARNLWGYQKECEGYYSIVCCSSVTL